MTAIPLDQPPLPCTGHAASFDVLIEGRYGHGDHSEMRRTVARCLTLCGGCPIKATCWGANADEEWVKRLRASVPAAKAVPTKDCERCGEVFVIGPRQGAKRYCSNACIKAQSRDRFAA